MIEAPTHISATVFAVHQSLYSLLPYRTDHLLDVVDGDFLLLKLSNHALHL